MSASAKVKPTSPYDILFVGMGAANCLLLLRLHDQGLLSNKTIAIVDPDRKTANDRTFCFWSTADELITLKLQELVSYSWDYIKISGIKKQQIAPLHYYHIRGIDLYQKTKSVLGDYNISYLTDVLTADPKFISTHYEIGLANETVYARKVFDSHPPTFEKPQQHQSHLYQSFYGWKIKTSTQVFDTSTLVMMDFNVPQNNFTQFIYVLPFEEDTALVELTRFGTEKLAQEESQEILEAYIKELGVSYEVLELEQAVIPMSSAKMEVPDFGNNWVNMGVRADRLKCTTGYAFHAMAEDALVQTEAIKNNDLPKRIKRKKRFLFYDRLLLKILHEQPVYGKIIFETLFKKIPINQVLRFLRENTSVKEEISIFSKLPKRVFMTAAIKDFLHRFGTFPIWVWPFLFTVFTIVLTQFDYQNIAIGILVLGFLSVGLSHGALDHLTSKKINTKKQLFSFAAGYLLKGALFGLVWLISADTALLLFIAYSAWHFGQADFKEWKLQQGWHSFLWGLTVLMVILCFHFQEFTDVLQQIPNLHAANLLAKIPKQQLLFLQVFSVVCGLAIALFNKSKAVFFTLIYLLLASYLPLLIAFGIYFVGQHSVHGWRHLLVGLNERSKNLWLKSLPFSIGGAALILCIPYFAGPNYIGMFFILLSCLSLPHVFSMHRFYGK